MVLKRHCKSSWCQKCVINWTDYGFLRVPSPWQFKWKNDISCMASAYFFSSNSRIDRAISPGKCTKIFVWTPILQSGAHRRLSMQLMRLTVEETPTTPFTANDYRVRRLQMKSFVFNIGIRPLFHVWISIITREKYPTMFTDFILCLFTYLLNISTFIS